MKQSKITFLTSVGAGLEYYDYAIYGLMASFISQQFFPSENQVAALFATFLIFAVGNIARPIGGIIFGWLGDRNGRRNIFANTLLWMAVVSFLMGVVPTFALWGVAASLIFAVLRILQGAIFSAEFPGALTLLSEHISTKRQGVHFGFMVASVGIGVSLGSGVIWLLTSVLVDEQMAGWGFRLPFLFGGFLAIIGFYIRKNLPETPKFLALKKSKEKISFSVVKGHLGKIFITMGILLFPASLVVFKQIFPVYLHNYYRFKMPDIYSAMTFGYIWSAILIPMFGWLSDYIGKKTLIIVGSIILIVFIFPVFNLLNPEAAWTVFVFVLFLQTVIGIMAASYFTMLPQAFKTVIRYTGTAFSHNMVFMLVSFTPLAINYIYGVLKDPNYLIWMFIGLAGLTVISTLLFKEADDDCSGSVIKDSMIYSEDVV